MRLNNPDANLSSLGSKPASAMFTLGTMHSISASPRNACDQSNSQKPHELVMLELSHKLPANSDRPTAIMMRMSIRWLSVDETTTPNI